jgi:hypothetical protein
MATASFNKNYEECSGGLTSGFAFESSPEKGRVTNLSTTEKMGL